MTNTTKAQVIAVVNAILGMLAAFNIGHLSNVQQGSVLVAANAILSLVVAVTYTQSAKRVTGPSPAPPPVPPSA